MCDIWLLPLEVPEFSTPSEEKLLTEGSIDEDDYNFRKNKPFYVLAPEIANGAEHSKESDIWSFGCILVEML